MKLIVKRDTPWGGRIRKLAVLLDGRRIGSIRHGEAMAFDCPAGRHELTVKMDWVSSAPCVFTATNQPRMFLAESKVNWFDRTDPLTFFLRETVCTPQDLATALPGSVPNDWERDSAREKTGAPDDPSGGFRLMLVWFGLCFMAVCALSALWTEPDPIFGTRVSCWGPMKLGVVVLMAAAIPLADTCIRLPKGDRLYGWILTLVGVGAAIHLMNAWQVWGEGMSVRACLAGYVMRFQCFAMLALAVAVIPACAALLASSGRFRALERALASHRLSPKKFAENVPWLFLIVTALMLVVCETVLLVQLS